MQEMSKSYITPALRLGSSIAPVCDKHRLVSNENPFAPPQTSGMLVVLFNSLVAVAWSVRYSFSFAAALTSVDPSGTPTFLVRTQEAVLPLVLESTSWIVPVLGAGTAPA